MAGICALNVRCRRGLVAELAEVIRQLDETVKCKWKCEPCWTLEEAAAVIAAAAAAVIAAAAVLVIAAAAVLAAAATSMRAERERTHSAKRTRVRSDTEGKSQTGPTRKWTEATRWTRVTDQGSKNRGCRGRPRFRDFDGKEAVLCVYSRGERWVCRAASGLCPAHFVCSEDSRKRQRELFCLSFFFLFLNNNNFKKLGSRMCSFR